MGVYVGGNGPGEAPALIRPNTQWKYDKKPATSQFSQMIWDRINYAAKSGSWFLFNPSTCAFSVPQMNHWNEYKDESEKSVYTQSRAKAFSPEISPSDFRNFVTLTKLNWENLWDQLLFC